MNNANTSTLYASTFFESTPETRPAFAVSGGSWRCVDADPVRAELGQSFYVEHHSNSPTGANRLFVGHRNANMDEIERVRLLLVAAGFRVRRAAGGLILTDTGSKVR